MGRCCRKHVKPHFQEEQTYKLKILMINIVCGVKSTGRICTDLADELTNQGHKVKIAYGRENVPEKYQKYAVRIGNDLDIYTHAFKSRIFDSVGLSSKWYTEQFINWVIKYDPDVIHMHNLHGYYINIEVLFNYLRTCGKRIIWTLHDCWAFTGHCFYFDFVNCYRWETGCHDCPKKTDYPKSFVFDRSRQNYGLKKRLFNHIPNLTIVTPSEWLAELVKRSYLKDYPVTVIHNGIDTDVFKPTPSDLREKLGIGDKKVVLGIASVWEPRKGLPDLLELNRRLRTFTESADSEAQAYQMVLIGINDMQRKKMRVSDDIITIPRTDSQKELAQYYTMADVYVTPTYEENYPTANLEAIACGTLVITYDTGGSGESARMYGAVVERGNLKALLDSVLASSKLKTCDFDIGMPFFLKQYTDLYLAR